MSESVRVYINGRPVDVEAGSPILQAIHAYDPTEAAAVERGDRTLTDSRGLPTPSDAPVHNGAIFRIIRARQTAATDDPDPDEL
jgi:hypothetical protein